MNLMQALQMVNTLRGSGNPMSLMEQRFGENPAMQRAKEMAQGKSPEQLKSTVCNLARQRGLDPQQILGILSQFGLKV